MTEKEIRLEAEERYLFPSVEHDDYDSVNAFIEGAKWAAEKLAKQTSDFNCFDCGFSDENEIYFIDGVKYKLIHHIDNSAPCSFCAFFNRGTLGCNFPENENKKCEIKLGTTHGWNTLEYLNIS